MQFSNTSGLGSGTTGESLIENALASGKPVSIGIEVRQGLMDEMYLDPQFGVAGSDVDASTPVLTDDKGNVEYHEILAIGYDQYGVWFQNSWGTGYGNNGYGRLTWDAVGQDGYEANTIKGLAPV